MSRRIYFELIQMISRLNTMDAVQQADSGHPGMEVNPANGPRINTAGGKAFADSWSRRGRKT